jgi:hypothetical protein
MSTAPRQFILSQIHYLLEAKSSEQRRHGLGLDQILTLPGNDIRLASASRVVWVRDPRDVRSAA